MKRVKILASVLTASVLLTGCFNSSFEQEAKKVKERKVELKKEEKIKKSNDIKEQKEFYKKLEKPLDEVIVENDLDQVKEIEPKEVQEKTTFEDSVEFAQYTSKILYDFYTQQISSEQYYKFLMDHGSTSVKDELPTEKDAITILTNIQDMYKKQNITGDGYKLTHVAVDRLKRDGTFYRKVITTNGEEYFLTTITKENKGWKFIEDSPSPPYTLEETTADQSQDENITIEKGK
ncbi:hypothetical protein FAY30_26425 (plasmid) [Bacillus sp. S3]|uniref:hypothetical protein n=1 Tax=Bacillus sp. S3 TaxID=486398 RepID=UPI00118B792F|nr:hypothetical protein [Bacillus sp. S3]QCJ45478.1 hypothetical protein FAY30_26425 [Bacillus sp. S3]